MVDAEDLANQRLKIKETLRRTQDARRPVKVMGLAKKGVASQGIGGDGAKGVGLNGNDSSIAIYRGIGIAECVEQDVDTRIKDLESEEGRGWD